MSEPLDTRRATTARPSRLSFTAPAQRWTEALPLGNGRLGAMVYGDLPGERVRINDDTFWSGRPRDWDVPSTDALRRSREQVLRGDSGAAELTLRSAQGPFVESYMPLADLRLELNHGDPEPGSYTRALDMDDATVVVGYDVGTVRYTRTVYVGADLDALVVELATDESEALAFDVRLTGPYETGPAQPEADGLTLILKAPDHVVPPYLETGMPVVLDDTTGHGMYAAVVVRVVTDGSVTVSDASVSVHRATTARLVLASQTGFRGFDVVPDRSAEDCAAAARDQADRAARALEADPAGVLEVHRAEHRTWFRRSALTLGGDGYRASHVVDLIAGAKSDVLCAQKLAQLLFDYGRYLLIASSRPGTQPANLQGIWNRDPRPPWSCNYTLNINTQMNYWHAGPAGLSELQLPLLTFVRDLAAAGSRTARVSYGLPGWVAHHNSDIWRQSMAVGDQSFPAVWANWWMGGAWLAHHLWDHYTFTLDVDVLRESYPTLRACAEFLSAWLVESAEGELITAPSTSPENAFIGPDGESASVTWAATMDLALVAQVLEDTCRAAEVLDVDADVVGELRRLLDRLRRPRIGSRGQLLEWPVEVPEVDPHHRHVSHLVGIFPGDVHARDEALCRAARVSLDERGDASTGWSRAWKANLWARLRDGDRAWRLLQGFCTEITTEDVTEQGGIYANLFCAHPPFQIDGNFGFTSAVCQMLVDSRPGFVELLPALPTTWEVGTATGLGARGGVKIDVSWRDSRLDHAVLRSAVDQTVTVACGGRTVDVRLLREEPTRLDAALSNESR